MILSAPRLASQSSTKLLPIKPAPPVTRIIKIPPVELSIDYDLRSSKIEFWNNYKRFNKLMVFTFETKVLAIRALSNAENPSQNPPNTIT
jgi:hypothetical protein